MRKNQANMAVLWLFKIDTLKSKSKKNPRQTAGEETGRNFGSIS